MMHGPINIRFITQLHSSPTPYHKQKKIHLGILEIKIHERFKGTDGITTTFMNTHIQLRAQ